MSKPEYPEGDPKAKNVNLFSYYAGKFWKS
jgi:hypothetical protein